MTDTPQWNDEPMDARLRDLAKQYNRPHGEVPRDAMWQAIAPSVRAASTADITDIAPRIERKRRHIAPYAWSAALAAGLVLGIALEREVLAPHSVARVAQAPRSTGTPRVAGAPRDTMSSSHQTRGATSGASGNVSPAAPLVTPSTRIASSGSRDSESSSSSVVRSRGGSAPSSTGTSVDAQQLYRLAARQTLVQAEALLTAYRADDASQRDQESMQQAGRWARDVLTSTRLLLDSPAAKDPQFRALFTDLELVLAQIVQLSGAPLDAGERELIERAMRDRDLLPRLRSALPAGAATE